MNELENIILKAIMDGDIFMLGAIWEDTHGEKITDEVIELLEKLFELDNERQRLDAESHDIKIHYESVEVLT